MILIIIITVSDNRGFPGGSVDKVSTYNAGGTGLIPGLGRCPGEGHGNPLPYLPGESHGWGACWATVHRVTSDVDWSAWACTRASDNKHTGKIREERLYCPKGNGKMSSKLFFQSVTGFHTIVTCFEPMIWTPVQSLRHCSFSPTIRRWF